jgi:hypothetical protein
VTPEGGKTVVHERFMVDVDHLLVVAERFLVAREQFSVVHDHFLLAADHLLVDADHFLVVHEHFLLDGDHFSVARERFSFGIERFLLDCSENVANHHGRSRKGRAGARQEQSPTATASPMPVRLEQGTGLPGPDLGGSGECALRGRERPTERNVGWVGSNQPGIL